MAGYDREAMEEGALVDRRFEVEGLARAGGMGSVFRARDRESGERVALKIAHPIAQQHAERFAREASVLAELRHPGIVRYVAHGRTEAGEMYLAMEWLEGEDLAQRLAHEGLGVDDSVKLVTRIGETLAAAHERGVVHRDLKPSNLFLPEGDVARAKLLDFGIVRVIADDDRSTQTGMVLGTIGYMAPEQARGSPDVDARADVFALGCVLFECLTGRPAFTGRDVLAVQAKILLEEAPRVDELRDDVPTALCDLVARMLAKDPERRPPNANALVEALREIAKGHGTLRPQASERRPGLTTGEQRLLCVILLSPSRPTPPVHAAAPTLASDTFGASISVLRAAAKPFGGRVEVLADGSVVVTLEGTSAATDQAARAARCALALRAVVPDVPIAIATGRGDASSRFPFGEVIDRAVHVLRVAEARTGANGQAPIEVDELTAGLLDARFDVRLRGAGSSRSAELVAVRDGSPAARTLLGKPTPFVGRTRELGMLEAIFDECVAEGLAQAVLVEAPAGVGKTRLAFELVQRLLARDQSIAVWTGRGDPMSVGSPFGLVRQAVRGALGIDPGDALPLKQAKLRARLSRRAEGRTLERLLEFVGELLDVPTPHDPGLQLRAARQEPVLMGDQMRRAFEDWLSLECEARPVLLVLEDLHWGDLPSVQFVDGALRQLDQVLSGKPFMVLALARPEVHGLFPGLWSDRKLTRMALGELTRKASERLVRHVLGDEVPESRVTRIVEHAAGNAFYLEEVIRAEADQTQEHLPPTVLAMVQARLEGLPPEARRVLRAAAVFGQQFWRAGVKALLRDLTESEIAEHLDDLARRELVVRRSSDASPRQSIPPPASFRPEGRPEGRSEAEWIFRHALVREAAYGMLVDRDRALGHRLAAEWLEKQEAQLEIQPVVLAEHFERGGSPERAARWFRRAAEEALEGNDFDAVVARAERGIECGRDLDSLGPLRLLQAEGHRWKGQLPQAERFAYDALQSISPDDLRWYDAAGELAVSASLRGSNERLVEVGELLRTVPLRADMLGAQIIAFSRAATWLMLLGYSKEAASDVRPLGLGEALCARIDEAAALLPEKEPAVVARVHYTQATRALVAGDLGEYLRLSEAAAAEFERAGIVRSLNVQRRNIGIALVQLGAWAEAERVFRLLLEEASRMHIGTLGAEVEHWLGVALARQGDLDEARAVEERAISHAVGHGARWIEGGARACLASMLLQCGLPADAEREARRAVDVSENSPAVRAFALAALSEICLARGAAEEALAVSGASITLLGKVGGIEEGEALARVVHAEALRALGRDEGARAAAIEARARLLARAAKIADVELRRSMLERVPVHARTMALAEVATS
ncbi:MAG: protein kinase [Deltaproteobacteria bacterium]|nr:protein kinase [Deltaproteobacteria bacterium]